MLFIRRLCILSLFCSLTVSAQRIEEGDARYMETAQFQFISEFFLGHEVQGNRTIVRTQPESRNGFYFTLKLANALTGKNDLQALLEVIPTDDKEISTYTFELPSGKIKKQLYLGLTGSDWPDKTIQPIAWRVRIVSGKETLSTWQSFLWEMPGK